MVGADNRHQAVRELELLSKPHVQLLRERVADDHLIRRGEHVAAGEDEAVAEEALRLGAEDDRALIDVQVLDQQHQRCGVGDARRLLEALDQAERQHRRRRVGGVGLEDAQVGRAEVQELASALLRATGDRQ